MFGVTEDSLGARGDRQKDVQLESDGGTYTFHMESKTDRDFGETKRVKATLHFQGRDASFSRAGEEVGYLEGHILPRPSSSMFHQLADDISEELLVLAHAFCDHNGSATRIETGLQGRDIRKGGFFQMYTVEIGNNHHGKDLRLRIVHETLVFLKNDWNLAVMVPSLLDVHAQKWPEENNRLRISRGFSRQRTPEEIQGLEKASLNITKHFARMGFVRAGRNVDHHFAWYLTANAYFCGEREDRAIGRWTTKQEARNLDIFVPPDDPVLVGPHKELHAAVRRTIQDQSDASLASAVRDIEGLVGRGASIQLAFALHAAAALPSEDTRILRTLTRLGGNVNLPDKDGDRPLHLAASLRRPAAISF